MTLRTTIIHTINNISVYINYNIMYSIPSGIKNIVGVFVIKTNVYQNYRNHSTTIILHI